MKLSKISQSNSEQIIKRSSIAIARMERDLLNKDEIKSFLGEFVNRDGVSINMRIKILAGKNRVIEEKYLEPSKVLVSSI